MQIATPEGVTLEVTLAGAGSRAAAALVDLIIQVLGAALLSGLVLAAEGLEPCVELARRHAIYCVLDPALAPRTFAEKLVYVADRRGGQAVEPLEERALDTARRNPKYAADIKRAVPLAKELELEVFAELRFGPDELAERVR